MEKESKIYVAGHKGMVGSAIVRNLRNRGFSNLVLRSSGELDLRNQNNVEEFFNNERPEYVFLSAAKVGGILANDTYKADFLYDNLMIQNNVINQSYQTGVKKLLFLGSSCIYPKMASQPLKEEYLLSGKLEPTNEPYAIAKIAGIKLCEAYREQYGCNFISAMPSNLYGPNDNYDLENSHVLPALLRKIYEAKEREHKEVVIWGTGNPMREFLHVDDLSNALIFLMDHYNDAEFINVGSGEEISIANLALLIKDIIGFGGDLIFDNSKPDGTPRKLLDNSKLKEYGWEPTIKLRQGIESTFKDYFKEA